MEFFTIHAVRFMPMLMVQSDWPLLNISDLSV